MPPEVDDPTSPEPPEADPVAQATAEVEATLSQVPANLRSTPEFKALSKELRKTAREKGAAIAQATSARSEAETFRLAAEATRQASIEAQLQETLGEDGIAAFQEIAELSESDPVAAGRKFRELVEAQSQAKVASLATSTPTPPAGGASVPPMQSGVDPNAPLQPPPTDEIDNLVKTLDATYQDVADRNNGAATRNRVTMKDRAAGFISYLGSAYTQALRGPKQ